MEPASAPIAVDATDGLAVGLGCHVTGGKFNGFDGTIVKLCDNWCSIVIDHENKQHEFVIETKWLVPMATWLAGMSKTEAALRGIKTQ